MTEVPAGAQLSDDGRWWWDGTTWQPVPESGDQPAATEGSGEAAEVTADDLVPVGDNDAAPGDDGLLTERLRPYFQPNGDDVPDDDSDAELDAALDENEFAGPAGE